MTKTAAEALAELRALGLTTEQITSATGHGLRRIPGCAPIDSILTKYRTGALSRYGVMAALFGTDSPQHHAGRAVAPPHGFAVLCEDGQQRHGGRFASKGAAYQFAKCGHCCCSRTHQIIDPDRSENEIVEMWQP